MASQPFGSRSYAGGKLPDRSMTANALPFSASTFSRRGLGATAGPGGAAPEFAADASGAGGAKSTQTAPATGGAGASSGPDTNPLNRLTEEQREEINEAVRFRLTWIDCPRGPAGGYGC